jgi:hypothetical protein
VRRGRQCSTRAARSAAPPSARAGAGSWEKQMRGSGGSLEPPEPLPTHLHTAYRVCGVS